MIYRIYRIRDDYSSSIIIPNHLNHTNPGSDNFYQPIISTIAKTFNS